MVSWLLIRYSQLKAHSGIPCNKNTTSRLSTISRDLPFINKALENCWARMTLLLLPECVDGECGVWQHEACRVRHLCSHHTLRPLHVWENRSGKKKRFEMAKIFCKHVKFTHTKLLLCHQIIFRSGKVFFPNFCPRNNLNVSEMIKS